MRAGTQRTALTSGCRDGGGDVGVVRQDYLPARCTCGNVVCANRVCVAAGPFARARHLSAARLWMDAHLMMNMHGRIHSWVGTIGGYHGRIYSWVGTIGRYHG